MIKGVVFDVDDTLYLERDYVRSGFEHVATVLARSESERASIAARLHGDFAAGGRGDLFDRLLADDAALAERSTVADLVEAYRTHAPDIRLAADVAATLDTLVATGRRVGILTDGPPSSQAAKVEALGLSRWCDPIVLTGSLGPGFGKPATAGFELIAEIWDLPGTAMAYVADNPEKDFAGPRRLGWTAIRVRRDGQLRVSAEARDAAAAAHIEIPGIPRLIARLDAPAT